MIEEAIKKLSYKNDLSASEMEDIFCQIAEGKIAESALSSFLTALSYKGETSQEIAGAARAMRKYVTKIRVDRDVILDTCGTGGDQKGIFNISTVAAFVVAGAGVTIAKHGNRSVSGVCGSADLLEAMGVNVNAPVAVVEKCIHEVGIGFLYAPLLHPAMGFVQPVRKKMKTKTIFNILGPLINPAFPTHQLLGVYDKRFVTIVGEALLSLGQIHAMVVWGEGGFDEVTTTGATYVCEVKDGILKEYVLEPAKLELPLARQESITGGDCDVNKGIALNVLRGVEGPCRDIVLLNAACGLYLAGRVFTIKEGLSAARRAIDSGAAIKKLNKLIECTNEHAKTDPKFQEDIS
jgi:anthranilate phosphoribosyltransferase